MSRNYSITFTPRTCELPNHEFLAVFIVPVQYSCGVGLKSNQKPDGYPHVVHATIAVNAVITGFTADETVADDPLSGSLYSTSWYYDRCPVGRKPPGQY